MNVVVFVIVSFTALIMLVIGLSQYNAKESPTGFYTITAPPKKDEISDIISWNRKHGIIWIVYGICIVAGFILGSLMPGEVLAAVFVLGSIIIPLPFLVMAHKNLEKKYKIK